MNRYHNLYQLLLNFDKLNSEEIINDEDFDVIFNKTEFNSGLGRFVAETGETTIDNKKTLGNLYIAEYLNDFVDYWKTIDSEIEKLNLDMYNQKKYLNIKIQMIKLLRNYSIYKGTSNFIRFVYNLYAHLTTHNFLSDNNFVIDSYCSIFSNFKNLEYNLQGNLPSYIWESVIKPICHPAGWVCNYSGNDYNDDYEIVCYDNHLKNNYCYIDFLSTNTIINNKNSINKYYFDSLQILENDMIKITKQNFQFDSLTLTIAGVEAEIEEGII
jgi:hypothetical protein